MPAHNGPHIAQPDEAGLKLGRRYGLERGTSAVFAVDGLGHLERALTLKSGRCRSS